MFGHGPLTASGSCLPASASVEFYVAPGETTRFDRETDRRRYRRNERAPVGFSSRPGVNTLVGDALSRYAEALEIRPGIDLLTPDAPPRPSPVDPSRELSLYQQLYRGIPVEGHGYLVSEENGIFRSAVGRFLPGLTLPETPAFARDQAVEVALSHISPAARPWTGPSPTADPPRAELLFTRPSSPTAPMPRLTWRVRFEGIVEARWADVDALTGAVIRIQPTAVRAVSEVECVGFNPDVAALSGHIESDVRVPFSSTVTELHADLLLGLWEQDAVSYRAFNNTDPFSHRTRYGELKDSSIEMTEHVCSQPEHPIADGVAALHWAMQATERRLSEFSFAGGAWEGVSGVWNEGSVRATLAHNPSDPAAEVVPTHTAVENAPSGVARIQINTHQNFAGVVSHEFAHAANINARARVGLPFFVYERESGALAEAYADIMAALTVQREAQAQDLNPWCMVDLNGVGCLRRFDSPASSSQPRPDTYEGEHWKSTADDEICGEVNRSCEMHNNSTVASHWFHVLVHGRAANETNDLGCAASVEPLAPELEESLQRAGQVVFSAFSLLPANADFLTAREQTAQVAFGLYGAEAEHAVEQAWHAVGVGAGARPVTLSPTEGETGVDPWPVTLRWEVGDQAGPWIVRYSADPDFTSSTTVTIAEAVEEANGRFVSTSVDLSADTTYYWQGREGVSSAPAVGWDNCSTFTAHFTTASKQVELAAPTRVAKEGYYVTGSTGLVRWEEVPGAATYEFRLSMSEDGCEASDWTDVSSGLPRFLREIYLGDTISFNGVLFRDPLKLWPDVVLDEDRTYHLYARAKRGGQRGSCSHFKIRKIKLLPFEGVSPLDPGDDLPAPALPFASGGPFVWTPSIGAVSYELSIYRRPALDPGNKELVLRERVDADEIVLNEDGNVTYSLHDPTATMLEGNMSWDVWARHSSGEEIPALGVDFGALEREFFNAAEEITDGMTEGGTHSPPGPGVTDVITTTRWNGSEQTRTCFRVPRNTLGMFYWFGELGVEPDPSDVHQVLVDPSSPEEYSLCTNELELTAENMLLAVVPYSWNVGAPWGFGYEHHFRFTVRECGGRDQICCDGAPKCSDWNVCSTTGDGDDPEHGTCRECGDSGELCCTGAPQECSGIFNDRSRHCTDSSPEPFPTCEACGALGEECCSEFTETVRSGNDLVQVTHTDWCGPDLACDGGTCEECGARWQPCCPSGYCTSDDDVCDGERCKARYRPCGQTFRAGRAEGGNFVIDLGRSTGTFDISLNTFAFPDELIFSIGGEVLTRTDCVATADLRGCTGPAGASGTWCCYEGGTCVGTFGYENGSQLTVDVLADCAGGNPDTEWEFTVSCPY